MKTFTQFLEEAEHRLRFKLYHHGTDTPSAASIRRTGPRPSPQGSQGPGHYVTSDITKARKYARFKGENPAVVSYRVPKKRVQTTAEIPKKLTDRPQTTPEKPVVQNVRTGHSVMDPKHAERTMIRKVTPVIRRKSKP